MCSHASTSVISSEPFRVPLVQGFAEAERLRTVRSDAERRAVVAAATGPLVRAAAALPASSAPRSAAAAAIVQPGARLLRLMLQNLMVELNGEYTDEGTQVGIDRIVHCSGSNVGWSVYQCMTACERHYSLGTDTNSPYLRCPFPIPYSVPELPSVTGNVRCCPGPKSTVLRDVDDAFLTAGGT